MLEKSFSDIYTKFKLSLYSKVFNQDIDVEDALSATEVLCVELIYAMGRPTINEFASFAQLSAPNAAYKVGNLVKKGYIRKVQSEEDKREYHLEVTEKYMTTYGVTYDYIGKVMKRIRERFSPEQVEELEEILGVIDDELMPEVQIEEEPKVNIP
ncbi:MAG: MarR family winged helix-turn-helix transcriptional regulator [Anaerovoracaceae bacterium]